MKGLLTKDLCLMLSRKRTFLIIICCGAFMCFSMDAAFYIGWMIMIGSLFSISTITYDEYDNCFPFLMTLPASRKCYAVEKYVFGLLMGLAFWTLGVVLSLVSSAVKGNTAEVLKDLPSYLIIIAGALLILDVSIPFNLKYGSEKGRIYMLITWGILFAAAFAVYKLIPGGLNADLFSVSLSNGAILAILAMIAVVVTAASVAWSVRIMEKKEF